MRGYVYVLSNPSMPGLYKIGCTSKSVEERIIELSRSTGVPTPFKKELSYYVYDIIECEKMLHQELSKYRVSNSKEFFKTELDIIKAATSKFYDMYKDMLKEFKESMALAGEQYYKKVYIKDLKKMKSNIISNYMNLDWFIDIVEKNGNYYIIESSSKIYSVEEYNQWKKEVIKQEKLIKKYGQYCIKIIARTKKYRRNKSIEVAKAV